MQHIDFRNPRKPNQSKIWEEGGSTILRQNLPPRRPSRPNAAKIAAAAAPILRTVEPGRISAIEQIANAAGERSEHWEKPCFGDFEYWLAHRCGWITDEELAADTHSHQRKRDLALQTSHRFSKQRFTYNERARYEEPPETDEYIPQVNMKLIKDRNLTDSARRIALFIMRHAYQDNRAGRFVGMTVTFIMKGLSISRRTVQRSLTLLESRGYFRCEVAHNNETRMCVGLIIHLMHTLFPKHHKEKWPEKRRNPDASSVPHKQIPLKNKIFRTKHRVFRITWAIKCMNGVARKAFGHNPLIRQFADSEVSTFSVSRDYKIPVDGGLNI